MREGQDTLIDFLRFRKHNHTLRIIHANLKFELMNILISILILLIQQIRLIYTS